MAFMIDNPAWFKEADSQIDQEDFSIPSHKELWLLAKNEYHRGDGLDMTDLLEAIDNLKLRQLLLELANFDYPRQETSAIFSDYVQKFKARRRERTLKSLKEALKEAEQEKNLEKVQAISSELQNILKDSRLTVQAD